MFFVEVSGRVIGRIDDDAQQGGFRDDARGPPINVNEERASQSLSLIALVDGETPDQHGGKIVSSHRAGVVESAFQEAPSERDAAPWATRLARLGNW